MHSMQISSWMGNLRAHNVYVHVRAALSLRFLAISISWPHFCGVFGAYIYTMYLATSFEGSCPYIYQVPYNDHAAVSYVL